jgi:hypothetical protein
MKKFRPNWWKLSAEEVPQALNTIISELDVLQADANEGALRNARLYGNIDMMGMAAFNYAVNQGMDSLQSRLSFNLIKSCTDSATNRIAKMRPRAQFLTDKGNWTQKTKAKKMSLASDALFYETNFYDKAQVMFRDGCLFDQGGWMKIFRAEGKVQAERTIPQEIRFDDIEAFYGQPRSLYQVKYIARDALLDAFPKQSRMILNAAPESPYTVGTSTTVDMIKVIEAWRLPSPASEGRHVISLNSGLLEDDKWTRDCFPFVWFQWGKPLFGFRSISLATELIGTQIELNRTLKTVQQIIRLTVPKLFVEKGSKVVYAHLNNEIGSIIEFTGTRPQYDFLQAVPPDLLNHIDRLIMRGYEQAGISMLSAASTKPAGLDSGKALRTFNDIETERFAIVGQQYENSCMEAAKLMLYEASQLAQEDRSFKLQGITSRHMETMLWKDIALEQDEYKIRPYPTSFLSNQPAGRLQDVQELTQAGFINKEMALKLLDFPDLEGAMSLLNAAIDDIDMLIENMIEKGEYQAPERYQNLQLAIQMTQSAYLRGKTEAVPEDRLELLRRFMTECDVLLTEASAPPMEQMPQMALDMMPEDFSQEPMAVPEAPPVSDLLPMTDQLPV